MTCCTNNYFDKINVLIVKERKLIIDLEEWHEIS